MVETISQSCQALQIEDSAAQLKAVIPKLNGCWALIAQWSDGRTIAAVDRSRSIPLFYSDATAPCSIASSPELLLSPSAGISIIAAAQLLLGAYISGRQTLFTGIKQVQAGEWVESVPGKPPKPTPYFRFFPDTSCSEDADHLMAELEDLLDAIFKRYAASLNSRRLILPLSAGYDSRLIGWLLYKNGIRDVLCYTYGVPTNPQVEIARRIAESLGYRWRFIPYNAQRWADCMASSEMREYWHYASRGTSSPHIQDFPAIFELFRKGDLGESPVFLPGHVGDAWACEFAVRNLNESTNHPPSEYHSPYRAFRNPVVSAIIYRHLNLWPVSAEAWRQWPLSELADRLATEVESYANTRDDGLWAFMEWVLRNRTANWIVNSGRSAEFFFGEFALCLGDYQLIDFFRKLPIEHLYARRLYARTLAERIFRRSDCVVSQIPVISGGTRDSRYKIMAVRLLQSVGLYKPLDRFRQRPYRNRSLASDCWFTDGKPSNKVTVGQSLERYDIHNKLPLELMKVLAPYLNKPAYSIQCNGLLAAGILAREFAFHDISAEDRGSNS
jgi:asparagine synthase (glutamine-hydrolysing)